MKCKNLKKINFLKGGLKIFIFFFAVNTFGYPILKDTSKLVLINSNINASVDQVFGLISKQTNYTFIYNEKHVKNAPKVFLSKGSISVPNLLKKALDPINSTFELNKNTIIVKKKESHVLQEKIEVKGIVVDKDNTPLPGVSIVLKGTKKGVASDFEGKFNIKVSINSTLLFSSVGFKNQEKTITANTNNLTVVMVEEMNVIDEVVLVSTGYQKVNPNQVTGSFTKVDMKQFSRKMTPDITSAIEGLTPSLVISSNPSTGSKVLTIRGISTLEGEASPLIVVDGFPYNGTIESINPYDIESINLLKDAATASIYGAKSANGVIVITTKKGYQGNLEVRYTQNYEMSSRPDLDYIMNRVSSSQLVDIQTNYFNKNKDRLDSYQYLVENNSPYAVYRMQARNKVTQLLIAHKEGRISQQQLDSELNTLRNSDNTKDIEDLLIETPFISQHNISASYGVEDFRLRTSLNYTDGNTFKKGTKKNAVNYNLNSIIDFTDKVSLDLSANFRLENNESNKDRLQDFFNLSSYEKFYDKSGNALAVNKPTLRLGSNSQGVFGGKDPYLIKELVSLGLLDETYYPALDFGRSTRSLDSWNARFQAQMKIALLENLDVKLGARYSRSSSNRKTHTSGNSWEMSGIINNFTKKNATGGKGELLIPLGGRLAEVREDRASYLLRGQLEYNKIFEEKHKLVGLFGSEIQSIKRTSTSVDRLGYNSRSNNFKQLDIVTINNGLSGLFMPGRGGVISGGINLRNSFGITEDRFFSVYSNLNYTYDNAYVFSASARIDQSNLFGTDPKYRFVPFWSVAGKWNIDQENFFEANDVISRLSLQASYGTNGNVSNDYGPYDIARSDFSYRANQANILVIQSFAVPDLRWETTNTFNIGANASLFNDRLNVTLDYYRKYTEDVLANAEADPTTSGTNFVKRNDATIVNNGYELTLASKNIHTNNFTWRSFLNLRFNNSKVEKIYRRDLYASSIAGRVTNRLGYEPNSLFVFDWSGVDNQGNGLLKLKDGTEIATSPSYYEGGTFLPSNLKDEDLKYAGTTLPKTVLGFTNNLEYKNFSLSFMLVYQGGHVMMRDSYNGGFIGSGISPVNKEAALAWQKPGDENNANVVPRLNSTSYSSVVRNSTKNIVSGDFLSLRDIVFSYNVKKDFLKAIKAKELTLNIRGANLYKWTKNKYNIDPETQGLGFRRFSVPKSISTGLILTF